MKILLFFILISGLAGLRTQCFISTLKKNSKEIGKNEVSIKFITNRKGESKEFKGFNSEEIAKLVADLVTQGESLRIHLDEDEMHSLFSNNDYFEISLTKPAISPDEENWISKFVYFLDGKYNCDSSKTYSYFFIASSDGPFIQSPFIIERNIINEMEKYLVKN